MRAYLIGEMSRRTGVNIETIRYYERSGLMPAPARSPGGNRQYNDDQLRRLYFIRRCRDLGFSIAEVRNFLEMVDRRDFTCAEVHARTREHIDTAERKIRDLRKMLSTLKDMASQCDRGDVPECPILDNLYAAEGDAK